MSQGVRWASLVIRRLLGVVPTLLGVSLLSFALLSLTPLPSEDDAERRAVLSRSLFADLPAFYNPEARDLDRDLDDALFGRGTDSEHEAFIDVVRERGSVLIPLLVPRLETLAPDARSNALRLLRPMLLTYAPDAEPHSPQDEIERWQEIYDARRLDFRAAHVRRLLRRLAGANDVVARDELVMIGTFAIATIVAELDAAPPSAVPRILDVLDRIEPRAYPARRPGDNASRVHAWREWWFSHEFEYRSFSRVERAFTSVSETRYGKWAVRMATFDFGLSAVDGLPIAPRLLTSGLFTLSLIALAVVLALAAAVPIGLYAASARRTFGARAVGAASFVLFAVPNVWVATLIAPRAGADSGPYSLRVVVYVACLFYPTFVVLSRQQRSAAIGVFDSDFVRTARAKGVSSSGIVWKHVLALAVLPVITLGSLQLPLLIGSAVVLESILDLPGLGHETLRAMSRRDVSWLVAAVATGSLFSIGGVFLASVASLVDPRVRRKRVGGAA